MLANLSLGTAVMSLTVMTHTVGLVLLTRLMLGIVAWFRLHRHDFGRTVAMVATVQGLFLIHAVEIWTWALVYLALGLFQSFEGALYFSTSTFATIGYGDVVLADEWRLLGALEGVNGFLLIGWSTAYLIAASTRHGPFRLGEHF
jgi:hypothetical protein